MTTENEESQLVDAIRLLVGGDADHQAAIAEVDGLVLDRIVRALHLLFFALERAADGEVDRPAPNSAAALACLAVACHEVVNSRFDGGAG